ncbi:hypothetical protein RHECIAT_CH0002726 [Rhizobium etli CIAT 652]|uniref:Uncharacterized protein n=1 Tax=Rhizobium etli (strain CIAT 652) TaxID=491916 RepID=B3PSI0_RHIE6|nr:hypothetical protein RHECIAT_CH0002726 [Rhizobium etli CIAT 652]
MQVPRRITVCAESITRVVGNISPAGDDGVMRRRPMWLVDDGPSCGRILVSSAIGRTFRDDLFQDSIAF